MSSQSTELTPGFINNVFPYAWMRGCSCFVSVFNFMVKIFVTFIRTSSNVEMLCITMFVFMVSLSFLNYKLEVNKRIPILSTNCPLSLKLVTDTFGCAHVCKFCVRQLHYLWLIYNLSRTST